MKTRLIHLTLACLLVAAPATAQVNYAVSGNAAYVASSPNASGAIVIASTYNGYPVTSIGDYAFSGCTNLTSVAIPNSVTNMGDYAFNFCSGLTSMTIPNGVPTIGFRSFFRCASLTSVTIPNSVTSIRNEAFRFCSGLTNVIIGNGVTVIWEWAFQTCTGLTSVTIPNSVTEIWTGAFQSCSGLTNVTIGNGVTLIRSSAFFGTSLTSVSIPSSVVGIATDAFYRSTSLTNFSVDAANPVYSSLNGVLFNKAQTALIIFPPGRGGSYVIPNSVTSIGNWAFYDCTSVTNVIIGNGVALIGDQAFLNCSNLTNFTFLGNRPGLAPNFEVGGYYQFYGVGADAKVYYYCGTTGWGATYGGSAPLPTVMLCPPQIVPGSTGMKPGGFGFTLTRLTNQTIVVEASTNLVNWQPISTNPPPGASTNFVDPEWLQHSNRFYRARSD